MLICTTRPELKNGLHNFESWSKTPCLQLNNEWVCVIVVKLENSGVLIVVVLGLTVVFVGGVLFGPEDLLFVDPRLALELDGALGVAVDDPFFREATHDFFGLFLAQFVGGLEFAQIVIGVMIA